MNQLIRCKKCDELFMKTTFDRWPEYEFKSEQPYECLRTIERDDFQSFLTTHQGHALEDLKIIQDSFVSDQAYVEPIKNSYFKATNGIERFVVKKFRDRIDEPLKYQLIHGDYSLKCVGIKIQAREIVDELEREYKVPPISKDKVASFLSLYQYIAGKIDIDRLERVPEESQNPLEIYYKMDEISLVYLLRNCRNIFSRQEYPDIEGFINGHKDDGVLLLKASFKIQVKKRAKFKKEPAAVTVLLEEKKVIEKE